MKISKSKQELASIISENGGWREGAEFAWFQGNLKGRPCREVWFGEEGSEPEYVPASGSFHSYWSMVVDKFPAAKFDNWHQAIISREEYFHLYPTPDADGWIEWSGGNSPVKDGVMIETKWSDGDLVCHANFGSQRRWDIGDDEPNIIAYRLHKPEKAKPEFFESVMRSIPSPESKPTIEQLVADYRNAKDYAERKRREADAANADADAKLAELVAAGEAIGLTVSPITEKQEPELVIAYWQDFQVGDEVEAVVPNGGLVKSGELGVIALTDEDKMWVNFQSQKSYIYYKCQFERGDVKFIRRP